jgi:DNA-binding MarR family transcriptional regulator
MQIAYVYSMKKNTAENQLGALCLALADAQTRAVTEAAGVNAKAGALMAVLGIHTDESIVDASLFLDLSHSATVRLVDQMVTKGILVRRPGVNKRSVRLSLTQKGRRLRRNVLDARQAVLEDALSPLTAEERKLTTKLLQRLLIHQVTSRTAADRICRLCDEEVCPNCPVEQVADAFKLGHQE